MQAARLDGDCEQDVTAEALARCTEPRLASEERTRTWGTAPKLVTAEVAENGRGGRRERAFNREVRKGNLSTGHDYGESMLAPKTRTWAPINDRNVYF